MLVVTLILHVALALSLVFFVLLHSGRGSGLSDMFGGALGATAAATSVGERNLDRITVVLALSFAFTTISLGFFLR
jgi:preprotein translocase subunit SecG